MMKLHLLPKTTLTDVFASLHELEAYLKKIGGDSNDT